ncbi:hypothetical protein RF55_20980 [Lasius niger]|uniref:Uncharacterized protein n=1 Tax=Lasius niger TaxID=67767 RepID=A0A0J7JYE1_LASNI|nr:hypothetical protein RF55_20980 [Lasius niger]
MEEKRRKEERERERDPEEKREERIRRERRRRNLVWRGIEGDSFKERCGCLRVLMEKVLGRRGKGEKGVFCFYCSRGTGYWSQGQKREEVTQMEGMMKGE